MDFKALEQNYSPIKLGSTKPHNQKKPKDFWTDQISTAGGILGGILGAPLGIIGAGGGSAVGSGLGEALENVLTGEDITKNVAQESILGGVFGAGPLNILKGAKGAVTAARGAKGATQGAVNNVAQSGGEMLKTSTGSKLQDLGNKALLSQYGTLPANVARQTNPAKTVGELADIGITNPMDAERIAKSITGASGILNRAVAKSVDKAGGVDTTGLRRIAEDALQLNGVVEKDASSVLSVVDSQLRRLQGGPAGSLNPLANPNDALDVLKSLEKRIANLNGKGGNYRLATPERADQARVLQSLHDEIQDRLYRGAGADKNISSVLTPEVRTQLLSLKPNDAKWQQFIDNKVMGARTIEDLRGAQAPFVRAGRIIDEADQNSITFGGRGGNLANNLGTGGIGGAVASAAMNVAQPVLARFGGQALRSAGNRAPGLSQPASLINQPRTRLGAAMGAGVTAPLISTGIDAAQAVTDRPPVSEDMPLESALMYNQEQPGRAQQLETSPYPRQNLIADLQRDPANAEEYISYYNALQEAYKPAAQPKLSATQQETANRAQNAMNDLSVLGKAIESGDILKTSIPGSNTAIGGNILGTTDIEAALFNIGDVILRARTGAQAPESEIRAFVAGFLPRGGESRESQLNKLSRAYRELEGMANPVGTQGGLEDALMALQR